MISSNTDPISLVIQVIAGRMNEATITWLLEGLRLHFDSGVDLAAALGLDRASRLRARNLALQDAAKILADDRGPYVTAGRLAQALCRYRDLATNQAIMREKLRDDSVLNCLLLKAIIAGNVPTTQRNIYRIIK